MSRIPVFFFFLLLCFAAQGFAQTFPAFRWAVEVDGSGSDQLVGLGTDRQGNIYLAGTTQSSDFHVKAAVQSQFGGVSDVFVTKLDPSGNVVYSTYFGGSLGDTATAMAVDAQGNVYVTGATASIDFPTTAGVYSASVPAVSGGGNPLMSFLFKLNPDGSVGYATYFSNSATVPAAIAVDGAGSVRLTGLSYGGVVTTPGAYRTSCACVPPAPAFSFFATNDAFLTQFDPRGSHLVFSTYLGATVIPSALAVRPDGSAYVAGTQTTVGGNSVFLLDSTGTSLIASAAPGINVQAAALASDGSLYLTGTPPSGQTTFVATPGAFQTAPGLMPNANAIQTAIVRMDGNLRAVLAGTYFGGAFGSPAKAMTLDAAGNVYVGGYTSPRSLPTRTPFVQGFGQGITGYVAELTGDLSTLRFSSPFGDNEPFGVSGLAIGAEGNVVLGGSTGLPSQNVWANSLILADPQAFRIDGVENFATHLTDPITGGEKIIVRGAGLEVFDKVVINGVPAAPVSGDTSGFVVIVPSDLTGPFATVQIWSGGMVSNSVIVALSSDVFVR